MQKKVNLRPINPRNKIKILINIIQKEVIVYNNRIKRNNLNNKNKIINININKLNKSNYSYRKFQQKNCKIIQSYYWIIYNKKNKLKFNWKKNYKATNKI